MSDTSTAAPTRSYHLTRKTGPLPFQWTEVQMVICDDTALMQYVANGWTVNHYGTETREP